jgi:RES domain
VSFPGTPRRVELPVGSVCVRVYDKAWYADALGQRHYGPLPSSRFDHHPAGPPLRHPGHGIGYVTPSLRCAVAEVFGDARWVDPWSTQRVGVLEQVRPLVLADTRGTAAVELGQPAGALHSRDRALTQRVARELYATTDCDGVLYEGWHTGEDCYALWERARGAHRVLDDRSLLDLDVVPELIRLADELHYVVGDLRGR